MVILDMLVTCDPVAEIDTAFATAAAGLRRARAHGDPDAAHALRRWIDHRLDQRNSLAGASPAPPHQQGRPARPPA